jgi:hypothetical protein
VKSDDATPLEELLKEAAEYVARMPKSAGARELGARLEKCRRTLESWRTFRPSAEQRQALRQQIQEVVSIARNNSPTKRVRREPTD